MLFGCWFLPATIFIVFIDFPAPSNCDELIFVQALWRHGDRNPIRVIPTDFENGPDTWRTGLGELTTLGISDAYKLGQLLIERYKAFLDPCLEHQVRFRSTDYNRTLMSASSVYAGMLKQPCYLNDKVENFDALKQWSPMPIHTTPEDKDFLLGQPCPKGDRMLNEYLDGSPEIASYNIQYKQFFNFISASTSWNIKFVNISRVADTLNAVKKDAKTHKMPHWANETVLKFTNKLAQNSLYHWWKFVPVVRLYKGFLLYQIIDLFAQKIRNDSTYAQKIRFEGYSAHDSTLSMLAVLLGVYKSQSFTVPTYSSCIVIELWRDDFYYYIKLFFRDGSNSDTFTELSISGCPKLPKKCTFDQFVQRSEPFIVKNPQQDCRDLTLIDLLGEKLQAPSAALLVTSLILAALASCSLIFTGLIVRLTMETRRRYGGYYKVRLDDMADQFFHATPKKPAGQSTGRAVVPDSSDEEGEGGL